MSGDNIVLTIMAVSFFAMIIFYHVKSKQLEKENSASSK